MNDPGRCLLLEEGPGARLNSGRRRVAGWIAVFVGVYALAVMSLVVWRVISLPTTGSGLTDQTQLLVAFGGLIANLVLVAVTVYYAWQTRQLVVEARATRDLQAVHVLRAARSAEYERIRGAVAALNGAVLDLVEHAHFVTGLRRQRRLRRVEQLSGVAAALTATSKATEHLRYIAPEELVSEVNALHREAIRLFEAVTNRGEEADLLRIAESIGDTKSRIGRQLKMLAEQSNGAS